MLAPAETHLHDARVRRDPTRTYKLRARLRAEGDRRWQLAAQTLRQALIEHDLVGLRGMSKLPYGDKTEGFGLWLAEELRQKVLGFDGGWLRPYIQEAANLAQRHAVEMTTLSAAVDPGRVAAMQSLAVSELKGIIAAAQQQIVRTVAHCLATSATPHHCLAGAVGVVKTMRNRTRAMADYIVVKTHATATLSALRSAGVTHVGTVAERLQPRTRQTAHGRVLLDKRRPIEEGEDVDVVTAGDDAVCTVCEEISDGGPYELDEAEGLIPAHPWCRCAFVPLSDARFANVREFDAQWFDRDVSEQPRAASAPGHSSGEFASEGGSVGGPDYEVGGAKYEEGRRLTSSYISRETSARKANSRKVPEIAQELNDRAHGILQQEVGVSEITRENATPQLENYVANALAMELKDGLRNGHSAETWYSDKMLRTMQIAEKLHPEIVVDQGKRFAFIAALSIASQGEKVSRSGAIADEAYTRFNKDGKFPTDIKVADPSITGNFEKMNKLIAKFGLEGTKKIFDAEYANRDLLAATGYKVGKTTMDDMVYGSAVLGPKIGQGFYQNLSGNFKPLTMDMWFMRSWGRLTGTGIGHTDMDEQRDRLRTELKRAGKAAPMDMEKLHAIAQKIESAHEADYKESRRLKTTLEHAAERFAFHYGGAMVEAPKGGNDRIWMTSVFDKALGILDKQGIHLSRASAQATWWTPEQGLYKHLGARVPQYDTDYAKVFEKIAKGKGVTVDAAMTLEFAPWIDDPDPPDDMTEADMDRMVEGFVELQQRHARDFDPNQARDPQGRWTATGGSAGYEFVSPATGQGGQLPDALAGLGSNRQRILREASEDIDARLGVIASHANAVGAWSDGAENSIVTTVKHDADWDKLRVAAAMEGHIADQKAVLVFKQNGGASALYSFHVGESDIAKLHENLLADGLAFHTIAPYPGGARVYVVDLDGTAHDAVAKAAERYDAGVDYQLGRAEFIGTVKQDGTDREQRDDARRAYEKVIHESAVPRSQEIWSGVRDHWGKTLGVVSDAFDPDEPRDPLGKWTAEPASFEGSSAAMGEATPTAYTREVDALRDKSIPISWQQRQMLDMYTGGYKDAFQGAEADRLDGLIKQFAMPRDIVLYRRVGWSHWNEKLTAHVGKDFTDPGFMSTTLTPELKLKQGSLMEIHVPKGAAALPVGSLSSYPEEAEVLFPRGSRMRIESATRMSTGPEDMKFVARLHAN